MVEHAKRVKQAMEETAQAVQEPEKAKAKPSKKVSHRETSL
jgi:hypothetical protein